jgi:CRP-like cAMP-binding protein
VIGECDHARRTGAARGDGHVSWCDRCALRAGHGFIDFAERDLELMRSFKVAHGRAWAGETVIAPGAAQPILLTLYSGCAVRYRTLSSGERQLLNVVLSGDLLGLESVVTGSSCYAVQAVTDVIVGAATRQAVPRASGMRRPSHRGNAVPAPGFALRWEG